MQLFKLQDVSEKAIGRTTYLTREAAKKAAIAAAKRKDTLVTVTLNDGFSLNSVKVAGALSLGRGRCEFTTYKAWPETD